MYYDCNLYLCTFLVSYTVILVVYDCCKWIVLYPHVNVQEGCCDFKVWENTKFLTNSIPCFNFTGADFELFSHVWDSL